MATASSFVQANEHEKMMQQMMQMQLCINKNVDPSYLQDMSQNSEKIANQVKQLCETGLRQQAQDTAMHYAKGMQSNPNFQAMQKCTTHMDSAFPGASALQEEFDIDALKKNHVCDEL
jgi:hypothetical protein